MPRLACVTSLRLSARSAGAVMATCKPAVALSVTRTDWPAASTMSPFGAVITP